MDQQPLLSLRCTPISLNQQIYRKNYNNSINNINKNKDNN